MKNNENNETNYDNRRSYNGAPLQPGETLVPILITHEMARHFNMVRANLETWRFSGIKVLVAFAPVACEDKVSAVKLFWSDVREYLGSLAPARCLISDGNGSIIPCPKSRKCTECPIKYEAQQQVAVDTSLDALLQKAESGDEKGFEPAAHATIENTVLLGMIIDDLIKEAGDINPRYGKILQMIKEEYSKGDIVDALNLGKSQGYSEIKAAQALARKLYNR